MRTPPTETITVSRVGDMYLRDDEKRILGINGQRAFSIDMATGEAS